MNTKVSTIIISLFAIILGASVSQAATFNIDFLNLDDESPSGEFAEAYFQIGLKDAWAEINGSTVPLSPVTIGILDTGFDSIHPEFKGLGTGDTPVESFVDVGEIVFGERRSHGTNVAGIIGANNTSFPDANQYQSPHMNGVLSGVTRLDYTLEMRQINLSGLLLFSNIGKISSLARAKAQVVNISTSGFHPAASSIFRAAVLSHPKILFVVAAGDNDANADNFAPGNLGVDAAGFIQNVITVGATVTANDGRTAESNFGIDVRIAAPGDLVWSPTFFRPELTTADYEFFSGTSASAPLVTGVAGLIKAINPVLLPAQIKDILVRTADPIDTDKPIGGRLNAFRAVCDPLVLNCTPEPPASAPFIQLTNTPFGATQNTTPVISRNGSTAAFYSNANINGLNPSGSFALFVMNSDGTGMRTIVSDLRHDVKDGLSLSSDGSKISFIARTSVFELSSVYVANTDGSNVLKLDDGQTQAMSADGSTVVYSIFTPFPRNVR
ncbi:MAG: S8 family serine peptidase [Candidatus Paceibacterota bacterium]